MAHTETEALLTDFGGYLLKGRLTDEKHAKFFSHLGPPIPPNGPRHSRCHTR